jgi:uncharacterized protein YndB with AHSA1/START domain
MRDLIADLDRVHRSVGRDGAEHVVELRRSYDAAIEDVWDACTNPERIPRWFLPVSGDLRLGGRFQLEGNAGGEIRKCEPPRSLALTWEGGGQVSHVFLDLDGATDLRLRHVVPDDPHWAQFGPGAVGVGWEPALLGLGEYLRTGAPVEDKEALATSPELMEFMRRSAEAWAEAHIAGGAPEDEARAAAARTSGFYAPAG